MFVAFCRGLLQKVGGEASRLKDERQAALKQKGELSIRAAALSQVGSCAWPQRAFAQVFLLLEY